jgi:hypothetical protein
MLIMYRVKSVGKITKKKFSKHFRKHFSERGSHEKIRAQVCVLSSLMTYEVDAKYVHARLCSVQPVTVAARSTACKVFARLLEHWGRGFESHTRHGCVSTFILCLCSGLAKDDLPSKESYRLSSD